MKRLFTLALLTLPLLLSCFRAAAQDDEYFKVYGLIQEGDSLAETEPRLALPKYIEAQTALHGFQKQHPNWNDKVVNFRLNYLAAKIAELSDPGNTPPSPAANAPANRAASASSPPEPAGNLENQVGALQGQVRRLQSDILLLEAKLKEAFSAQPAASDPREFTRSQDRIVALEKENSLLKVTLAQQQARMLAGDTNLLERMQRGLENANRRAAEQGEKASLLAQEKEALQGQMAGLRHAATNAAALEEARKTQDRMNRQLMEQVGIAAQLAAEKNVLQANVKKLTDEAQTAGLLRAENEILKKQLAAVNSAPPAGSSEEASRLLAEARQRISALESDKNALELEKIALENQVKQLKAPTVAAASFLAADRTGDAARIKQLEQERADLQKRLEAAQKELYGRKSKGTYARIEELNDQLVLLRTRLGVMEAQRIPYSDEELALFKKPAATLASTPEKPARVLPSGSATFVAEAQRDFTAGDFEQAEKKYLQVYRQDDKNVYTLANLATIQMAQDHLEDAEQTIKKAVALAPDDAYSLLIAGQVQFRRGRYNEALDALGRAAKKEPRNAEIQNYLGLVLSEKGLRGPAEAALRKAIQLNPNYGDAHINLAVIYATQRPPLIEMARWHYEKALAAGVSKKAEIEQFLEQAKKAEAGQ